MKQLKYSILDLAALVKGDSISDALKKSVESAQLAEKLGYTRYWFSEHHNMQHVVSSATSILIGHVAEKTKTIRVGSGGIMLPNHSTLSVAEQFGTLDALYPGRIDLGLGRAPGTDLQTAAILRRGNIDYNYDFEYHIQELSAYFNNVDPEAKVRAFPGEGANVPLYILGSSTDSAFVAAKLGKPYAFAGHFAPTELETAVKIYKKNFRPSKVLEQPYMMVCANFIAADTVDEAHYLSRSLMNSFVNLITNNRQALNPPQEVDLSNLNEGVRMQLARMTALSLVGDKVSLTANLKKLQTILDFDELIISSSIYDLEAKHKSYKIAAEIIENLKV